MGFTRYQTILVLMLVVSGSINTISVKWMDMIKAKGRDGIERVFMHPFFQADLMFIGETLCLVSYIIIFMRLSSRKDGSEDRSALTEGSRTYNKFVLLPPALMDITGTSLMYYGLSLTNASSFQMLRGSVIVFVAILSFFLLKRKILLREWIGIALIILALVLVGLSDILQPSSHEESHGHVATTQAAPKPAPEGVEISAIEEPEQIGLEVEPGTPEVSNVLLGDTLIIIAQLITASQMVYEEAFIVKLDVPPLQMVGFEGIFGFTVLSLIIIPLNYIPNIDSLKNVNAGGSMEDPLDAFAKIGNNSLLWVPIIGLVVSIAFFNYAGISLTKEINATTRMVLDSIRILVVWAFALIFGWQSFHWLQLLGFFFLITGMCTYNNIIIGKITSKFSKN